MAIVAISDVDRGDIPQVTATFKNSTGVLTNPTTVTFYVRTVLPNSTETSYVSGVASQVTNPSVGVFVLSLTITEQAAYLVRPVGTGSVVAAGLARINVQRDTFV